MTKKDAEYIYGSLEAYYWITAGCSVLIGIIAFFLQIFINGTDKILEDAAYSCFFAGAIFQLATLEITLDSLKEGKINKKNDYDKDY